MSAEKAFFDTNIFFYAYSSVDPKKQVVAQTLFRQCLEDERLVISTQVIQEFYVAGSRKLAIAKDSLVLLADRLLDLPVVQVTPALIRKAMRTEGIYQISFGDVLIVTAASVAQATVLYTEDLNHGQLYEGVRADNPFRNL